MSIRRQMAFLLIALSAFLLGTTWVMQAVVIAPAFGRIERQAAVKNLVRCVDALKSEIEGIDTLTSDYAAWDDTCQFVADGNEAYRKSNLTESFHETTGNDFFAVVNPELQIIAANCLDPTSNKSVDCSSLIQQILKPDSGLALFSDEEQSKSGLIRTEHGIMLIASRPILTSKREGPVRGAVLMGRLLSPARIAALAKKTHVNVQIHAVDDNALPAAVSSVLPMLPGVGADAIPATELDENTLQAVQVLNDVFGEPLVVVRLLNPRTISQQGKSAANAAMICSLIGVLSMILGTGIALRMRVVEPLQRMAAHATHVGKEDNLDARLQFRRSDEIGILAHSFDNMVERLAEARHKGQGVAHRAGMAEIASEVLHNVGNAVNTANCCAELVEDRLNGSRVSGLEMATMLLSEQAPRAAEFFSQDPRGPKLVNYLIALNGTLQKERSENLAEVRRLQETIRHIRDTIASQQEYARHSDFRQRVDLKELIDETLLVNAPLQHQAGVQVEIEAETLPEVFVNRSRVSQVLVNIQKNAILSMQSLKGRPHVMTIELTLDIEGALIIRISDTGQGFTPEVKARLFAQGFTTRSSGSGVGLHYCANVLREMGGEITADSDGPGLGARFQIRIPRAVRVLPSGEFSATDQIQPSVPDFSGQLTAYSKEEQFA